MAIDTASNDVIKKLIHRRRERLKDTLIRDVDNVEQLQTVIDYAVRESRTNPMLGLPSMIPDQVTELWNEIHND